MGKHSIKLGGEYRVMRYATVGLANVSGTYSFTRGMTASNPQVTDTTSGNAIASFLLGTMSAGSAALNASPYLHWHYPALFWQDDWQVTRRLSVNLGLRWDIEGPPVEKYNRQNRGFVTLFMTCLCVRMVSQLCSIAASTMSLTRCSVIRFSL